MTDGASVREEREGGREGGRRGREGGREGGEGGEGGREGGRYSKSSHIIHTQLVPALPPNHSPTFNTHHAQRFLQADIYTASRTELNATKTLTLRERHFKTNQKQIWTKLETSTPIITEVNDTQLVPVTTMTLLTLFFLEEVIGGLV